MNELAQTISRYKHIFIGAFAVWMLLFGITFRVAVFLTPAFWQVWLAVSALLPAIVIAWWLKKSFVVLGFAVNAKDERIPVTTLVLAFWIPTRVYGPGMHFRWWPIERFKFFPTPQYRLPYRFERVYSKNEDGESTQTMDAEITLYYHWPRLGETYHFPARTASSAMGEAPSENEIDVINWEERDVFFLLKKAHFGLPYDPMKVTSDQLREFFREEVHDAIQTVCAKYSHSRLRHEKELVKHRVNKRILAQEGPFYEVGAAWECTEVAVVLHLPEDTEQAARAPEIAANRAAASVQEARGRQLSATKDKQAIAARLQALMSEPGTSPQLAQLLAVGGVKGEGMEMAQFRDFALSQLLLGRQQGAVDILAEIDRLTPDQIEALKQKLGMN